MKDMDLSNYTFVKSDNRGNQPRQQLVEKIMYELQIDRKHFKGILMCGLNDQKLTEVWQRARSWKVNPPALFWKLLREERQKLKDN